MRLLRTRDLTFHEFFGEYVPPYCIVSHRWGERELTYHEIKLLNFDQNCQGYQKIVGSADLAQEHRYDWLWIDTCCIDKASSSELSEAINSMFRWYNQAGICIAYLNDVDMRQDVDARLEAFRNSKWFTRGWTLQELIAPAEMDFYDCNFKHLGSKYHLSNIISHITGIAAPYLDGRKRYHEASIAMRLSWSAGRETTRAEDMSYSLLGLLQVNMPLLYGEGEAAFLRLQLTIIETSDDESIFAWLPQGCRSDQALYGMLAERPADFARSKNVERVKSRRLHRLPYAFTNKGVAFKQHVPELHQQTELRLTLACTNLITTHLGTEAVPMAFYLRQVGRMWCRARCQRFHYTRGQLSCPENPDVASTFHVVQPNLPGSLVTSGTIDRLVELDSERRIKHIDEYAYSKRSIVKFISEVSRILHRF